MWPAIREGGGRPPHVAKAGALDQHQELVAPEAADRIRLAQRPAEAGGHLAQHIVTDTMAQGVVHVLESVEVDEEHRPVLAGATRPPLHLFDAVQDECAVRQAGEGVTSGQLLERFASRVELGDVVGGHHQPVDRGIVEQVDDAQLEGNRHTTIAAPQVHLDDGRTLCLLAFEDRGQTAPRSADRSAGTTRSSRGWPSTSSWSWPRIRVIAAETDSTVPVRSSSRRMLAELCTRDRKRSMSLVATSQRRRSVRSRTHRTSPSIGEAPTRLAPISSTSFQPVDALTRNSIGEPTFLPRTLLSDVRTRLWSSGWTSSSRVEADDVVVGQPEDSLGGRIAPDDGAVLVGHDDRVGQRQDQMFQPRRFHKPSDGCI